MFPNNHHFDGLVQDCSIFIANMLEILQSCTKPSILVRTQLAIRSMDAVDALYLVMRLNAVTNEICVASRENSYDTVQVSSKISTILLYNVSIWLPCMKLW